jgi:hypothetical protein
LLDDGDKGIEIVYGEENKNILYRHNKPNKPIKQGPLSVVLFESPFTSLSTSQKGQPLSSLSGFPARIFTDQVRIDDQLDMVGFVEAKIGENL